MPHDLFSRSSAEASEKFNTRSRQPSLYFWHVVQHRATRRIAALILVLVVWYYIYLSRSNRITGLPPNPPTPFVLTSSRHSERKTSLSRALSPVSHLSAPKFRPRCEKPSAYDARYSTISNSQSNFTIYLALNLYNSEAILPTFIHELPNLMSFIGPHRFHVSILENGSDDMTPSMLTILADVFDAIGTSYEIVVKGENFKSNKADNRRIVELAYLRNAALDTLYSGRAASNMGIPEFDVVLFMNDIVWCTNDILEAIYEHVTQGAHQTCTMDWGNNVVYDRWVVRSLAGLPFYSQDDLIEYFNGPQAYQSPYPRPHPYEKYERERFEALKPFQVFSCWNGASVIDARAFSPPKSTTHPVKSQKHGVENNPEGIRFRTAVNDVSPVTEKASECFLFSVDMWKRGMHKIMIIPKSSVAYNLDEYERIRQDGGRTVEHPIGIELSGRRSRIQASHMAPISDGTSRDDTVTERIQWITKPPERVVYHDYAWWHETERWGYWDEA